MPRNRRDIVIRTATEWLTEVESREHEKAGGEKHCGVRARFESEGLWECFKCGAYKFWGDKDWSKPGRA